MNRIAFIALANDYCETIREAVADAGMQRPALVSRTVRLLPRLYIAALDLNPDGTDTDASTTLPEEPDYSDDNFLFPDDGMENLLDEDSYDAVRRRLEAVFGAADIYLEVFEEDMKYSDTPVSASISEGLADIFQVLFNYIGTVREATESRITSATAAVREDFTNYWSRVLCNVLRALNALLADPDANDY